MMINLTIVQIFTGIVGISILTLLIISIGYLMGRKTKTDEPIYQPKVDQGSTEEPEGDISADNLYDDEKEERVSTI